MENNPETLMLYGQIRYMEIQLYVFTARRSSRVRCQPLSSCLMWL